MNIVEIATGSDDLNILVRALGAANLVDTIQASTGITVFAPSDAAFTRLALDLGFAGDSTDETAVFDFIAASLAALDPNGDPVPLLTDILFYHVSASVLDAATVTQSTGITTLLAGAEITPDVPVLNDLEPDLIDPALIQTDIAADNGIVHLIDRVLLPFDVPGNDAPSITEIVAASGAGPDADNTDFDLLLAAVQTAGLADTLNAPGDLTVFAPDDAAFISLARQLGFTGTDEAGALDAIVATLTALGGGDPIPLLTAILTYHVAPESLQLAQIAGLTEIATLQGGEIGVSGTVLIDAEPDLVDPSVIATDIQASNGIVHVIDNVLIPVDIPASNGANDVRIVIDPSAGKDRLAGGVDNDLLLDGLGLDLLIGGAGGDIFALAADGSRNKVIDFELGADLIDVSSWGVGAFDTLNVIQRSDASLLVFAHGESVVLQTGAPSLAGDLTADSFIFGTPEGVILSGTDGRDRLEGGFGDDVLDGGLLRDLYIGGAGADSFVLGADQSDKVIDFVENQDLLDVSGWGVALFDELTISQRSAGSVLVQGNGASAVVQAADGALLVTDLDSFDFVLA